MHQGSPLFQSFAHCHATSTILILLPWDIFTPSIQHNVSLLHTRPPLTSDINTLLALWYSSILFTSPNHLNTLRFAVLPNSHSIPALLRTSSFLTSSVWDTPTKLHKYFISRTFTFSFSALLIPHASALYNAIGTITPSYRHFFTFFPNLLLFSTLFSAPHSLYPLLILCPTSLSQPLSVDTYGPRYLKRSSSLNGSPFSLTCIRPPFPYLEHLITLLLPTTLNFLSHNLPNSLTSLHNFCSKSATSAVSSANNSWFISMLPPFTLWMEMLYNRAQSLINYWLSSSAKLFTNRNQWLKSADEESFHMPVAIQSRPCQRPYNR